jgi:hypothetical protein
MEGGDALALIAEIGIAIAGFAGVIATLRAPGGRVGAYLAMRIAILFVFSASAVLLALLPFAFQFADLASATIWALSSSAMLVIIGTAQFVLFRISRTALPSAPEDRAPGVGLVITYSAAILAGVHVLQLANAAFLRQLWPFYVGLLIITTFSLFMFAYTLFAPSRVEVPA